MHVKHQLWNSFRDINASDEMYFPTCLALLGLLRYRIRGTEPKSSVPLSPPSAATNASKMGAATEGTAAPWKDRGDNHEQNRASSLASNPHPEVVLKRPVTYTDWTEGMRNPATFTKGIEDFKRVAKIARGKGCLVARKFASYVPVPGAEPIITGQVTCDEWFQAIQECRLKEEQERPHQYVEENGKQERASGKAPQEDETTRTNRNEREDEQQTNQGGDDDGEKEKEEEEDGEKEKEEDDDQGERELE